MPKAFYQRFCATCGSIMRQKRSGIKGYDIYTGKPWYEIRLHCPNWRLWKPWHETLTADTDMRKKFQLGEGDDE